jgi:hypothetical protein
MTAPHNIFRDGKVHVCERMCSTCIFRPGNLMNLRTGRVDSMVTEAVKNDSTIVCHATLDGDNAACRGFFEQHKTAPLQIAERLGYIEFQEVQ